MDYETNTGHSVTIEASNGVDAAISKNLHDRRLNVVEGVLGPTFATFRENDVAGSLIFAVTGLDAGAE